MLTALIIGVGAAILVVGTLWSQRRCACQRETPLASLVALHHVTTRARKEQLETATGPSSEVPRRAVPPRRPPG